MKIYNNITMVPIERIKPYENNPRHNEATIALLVRMIQEVGFNVPIVLDKNYVIVKGHSRYAAATQLGISEIPCIISQNSKEDIAKDRLIDNKLSELSKWDDEKLRIEVRDLDYEIPELGISFETKEIETLDVKDKDIAKAQDRLVDNKELAEEKKEYLEIICSKCGESFYVDSAEVERYSK